LFSPDWPNLSGIRRKSIHSFNKWNNYFNPDPAVIKDPEDEGKPLNVNRVIAAEKDFGW